MVRATIADIREIETSMDEGRDNCRLCSIALIEDVGSGLDPWPHRRDCRDQKQFADDFGTIYRRMSGAKE